MSDQSAKPLGGKAKHTLHCSFCGKSQHEVRKLIAGPTVFVCDECVELCEDIITDMAGDHQDGDIYRLSISKRQLEMLSEKHVTLGNILGRELSAAKSLSEIPLSEILNAIGRVVLQELGSTAEHASKIAEAQGKLEAARTEHGDDSEEALALDSEHRAVTNDFVPPIVRLLTII